MACAYSPAAASRWHAVSFADETSPSPISTISIRARIDQPNGMSSPVLRISPRGDLTGRRLPSGHMRWRPDRLPCALSTRAASRCIRATSACEPEGA